MNLIISNSPVVDLCGKTLDLQPSLERPTKDDLNNRFIETKIGTFPILFRSI